MKVETSTYLTGQLLIAMPGMPDPRFARSVIHVCAHSPDGAMGLVLNRHLGSMTLRDLMDQISIQSRGGHVESRPIHYGGPVESGRGFVLHSAEYAQDSTLFVDDQVGLTATLDVLRDIVEGKGPHRHLIALGYAGWGPGQLDREIRDNGWLSVPADDPLIFDGLVETKWARALAKIGIDPAMLSDEAGHA